MWQFREPQNTRPSEYTDSHCARTMSRLDCTEKAG